MFSKSFLIFCWCLLFPCYSQPSKNMLLARSWSSISMEPALDLSRDEGIQTLREAADLTSFLNFQRSQEVQEKTEGKKHGKTTSDREMMFSSEKKRFGKWWLQKEAPGWLHVWSFSACLHTSSYLIYPNFGYQINQVHNLLAASRLIVRLRLVVQPAWAWKCEGASCKNRKWKGQHITSRILSLEALNGIHISSL